MASKRVPTFKKRIQDFLSSEEERSPVDRLLLSAPSC